MMDQFFSTISSITEDIFSNLNAGTDTCGNNTTINDTSQKLTLAAKEEQKLLLTNGGSLYNQLPSQQRNEETQKRIQQAQKDKQKEQEQQNSRETDQECPLCLNPMCKSDLLYPIHCPTYGCDFNYCSNCIWNLLLSSSQDYEIASDGSKQLKVQLQCPQCRSKYFFGGSTKESPPTPTTTGARSSNTNTTPSTNNNHYQIVQDVLLCRRAYNISLLLNYKEDEYTASQLTTKQMFLQQVTWESLYNSHYRIEQYLLQVSNTNDNKEKTKYYPCLNYLEETMPLWKKVFGNNIYSGKTDTSIATNKDAQKVTLVDPTLLRGLEEIMSFSEQQFVTQLLISGQVFALVQASQILHGMLTMDPHHVAASMSKQKLQQNNNYGSSTGMMMVDTIGYYYYDTTILSIPSKDVDRFRKLFPLPKMPSWVNMPLYDPYTESKESYWQRKNKTSKAVVRNVSRTNILTFDEKSKMITNIRGIPGRLGLRNGDIITHVNLEPFTFETNTCFMDYLEELYNQENSGSGSGSGGIISIVVNANSDTANALKKRSKDVVIHLKQLKEKREYGNSERSLAASSSFGTSR